MIQVQGDIDENYNASDELCNGHKTVACERLTDTEPLKNHNEIENQASTRKKGQKIIAQSVLTTVVTIAAAGLGMPIGYSAVLLPQLQNTNGSLRIDDDMGSWIASIHSAATPAGSFLSGLLMDYFGRKLTIQISCIPIIIGWALIGLAQNHGILLAGRVLAGIAVGLAAAPSQVYIAEISDPELRGVLSIIPFASYSFGILLIYVLGSTTHWRLVAGLSAILPTVALVLFCFLPESPAWLVKKDRIEAAKKASKWLKGGDMIQSKHEIQNLIAKMETEKAQQEKSSQSIWSAFLAPQSLKPFIIVNIFNVLQSLTGTYLIVFYAVEIIAQMGGENVNENFAAILTAGVRFIFTIIASILLAFVGRRSIGIGSALGTGISALCLGMFLYSDCKNNSYFAAVCLLCYVAANTLGLFVLPGVMVGEMFPARVRGISGSLTLTIFNLVVFLLTKVFPLLKKLLGIHGFFFLFAIVAFITSLFVYLTLPETKDKGLSEIESYFSEKNILWTRRRKSSQAVCKTSTLKS